MLIQILTHTPAWVFAVFGLLLFLGMRQLRSGTVGLARITIVPIAMAGLAIFGVVSVFGDSHVALAAWAGAAALCATLVMRMPLSASTAYDAASRRFHVTGSAAPLVLMMGIFITKYAVGVTAAMMPALPHQPDFALGISALYGLFSGIFIGRAARLWRLALNSGDQTTLGAARAG